ncbi:MAG TPA: type IX secretion system outer membrane channel protein PorV [Bacteroidales bacterium]|nr:type IX secretion system outer membrane channel protein PorV [Bacteroidales bacterium]
MTMYSPFNMKKILSFVSLALLISNVASAQISNQTLNGRDGEANVITTAVPFLTIAPDSRSGAMGDAGVSTSPDINSQHHNPAKYAFMKNDFGISISYTPWLRQLVNDINLAYVAGYKKIGGGQAISGSLRYFSLGDITFTNMNGDVTGQHKPNEFALDFGYNRMLGENISGSITLRYVNSNLTGGYSGTGPQTKVGQAFASDISAFYKKQMEVQKKNAELGVGINISNIGSKMSYTDGAIKDFLPAMLRLGSSFKLDMDDYNSILGVVEMSKLLVPTPPIYYAVGDTLPDGSIVSIPQHYVRYGKPSDVFVPTGIFQSFWDAPGVQLDPLNPDDRSRFKEEWREVNWSIGLEYWYSKQFALRGGYFHEDATKGNRKFFTVGLGLKLKVFALDFSYLIPTAQRHPLGNTLRFTIMFDFEASKKDANPQDKK